MDPIETFLWGFFGGLGAEVSVVFALRHRASSEYPHWLKSWTYYAVAFVMVIVGGVIAVAYSKSGTTLNAILAIQIGASAPLIFRKLLETVPDTPKRPDPTRID